MRCVFPVKWFDYKGGRERYVRLQVFEAVDMVLPFVAAIIDRATGYVAVAPSTRIHTKYTEL